jgi:hypothetical protein
VLNPSFISNVSHCKTLTRVCGNSKKFCDFFLKIGLKQHLSCFEDCKMQNERAQAKTDVMQDLSNWACFF